MPKRSFTTPESAFDMFDAILNLPLKSRLRFTVKGADNLSFKVEKTSEKGQIGGVEYTIYACIDGCRVNRLHGEGLSLLRRIWLRPEPMRSSDWFDGIYRRHRDWEGRLAELPFMDLLSTITLLLEAEWPELAFPDIPFDQFKN